MGNASLLNATVDEFVMALNGTQHAVRPRRKPPGQSQLSVATKLQCFNSGLE
jgi:hypothetical protein